MASRYRKTREKVKGLRALQKEDIFVNITLCRVPGALVREFALRTSHKYPGGINEAIQELMKQAIKQ